MNLKLDSAGDLAVENNELVLFDGADEITQLVQQRLNTFLGEYFYDTSIGVPYFEQILVKNPQPAIVYALLKNMITETDGVTELTEFDVDYDAANRTMDIDMAIKAEGNANVIKFKLPIGVIDNG